MNSDIVSLKLAKTDAELHVALTDTHAVLESTMRGYLADVRGIEGVFDKSKLNFPSLVQVLNDETGDSIMDAEMTEAVLAFNSLRNRVVHDAHRPSYDEVNSGVLLTAKIVKRLIGNTQPSPSWQVPFHSIAGKLGGDLTYSLGVMMVIFSVLYIINPIDIPGPLDDVGIVAPCLFSAVMLINAARMIKKRSSRNRKSKS